MADGRFNALRNNLGDTPLHVATTKNRLKVVRVRLALGTFRRVNNLGRTPLHLAAASACCATIVATQGELPFWFK